MGMNGVPPASPAKQPCQSMPLEILSWSDVQSRALAFANSCLQQLDQSRSRSMVEWLCGLTGLSAMPATSCTATVRLALCGVSQNSSSQQTNSGTWDSGTIADSAAFPRSKCLEGPHRRDPEGSGQPACPTWKESKWIKMNQCSLRVFLLCFVVKCWPQFACYGQVWETGPFAQRTVPQPWSSEAAGKLAENILHIQTAESEDVWKELSIAWDELPSIVGMADMK